MEEKQARALELLQKIGDEQLQRFTMVCMELLANGDLSRDFERAEHLANAMLREFHKEVSDGLLHAIVINLVLTGGPVCERLFQLMQDDRELVEMVIFLASYAEMLAPACKREAEKIQAEIQQGSTDPTPGGKNRS